MGRFSSLEGQKDALYRRAVADKQRFYSVSALQGGGVSAGTQSIQSLLKYNLVIPFADRTAVGVQHEAAFIASDVIRQVARAADGQVKAAVLMFARNASKQMSQKQGLARVHQRIANEARSAVIANYQRKVNSTSYRGGARGRLSGRMIKALNDDQVIRAQRDGILYMNTAVLDREAAHWRRLNYGAGRAGRTGGGNQPHSLIANGQKIGTLRLSGAPSPAFGMPLGVWLNNSGQIVPFGDPGFRFGDNGDQFWLLRQARTNPSVKAKFKEEAGRRTNLRAGKEALNDGRFRNNPTAKAQLREKVAALKESRKWVGSVKETRGIRGYHFFDAGLKVIGQKLPNAYVTVGSDWMHEAATGFRPPPLRMIVV